MSFKIKTNRIILVVILIVSLTAVFYSIVFAQSVGTFSTFSKVKISVVSEIKTHTLEVELALTPQQHAQGLMFRRSMDADKGMLFVYKSETPISMWMKNTFLPLDIFFIDRDGSIIKIVERTVPLSTTNISSGRSVIAALELNAGAASRLGIQVGDKVLADILRTLR